MWLLMMRYQPSLRSRVSSSTCQSMRVVRLITRALQASHRRMKPLLSRLQARPKADRQQQFDQRHQQDQAGTQGGEQNGHAGADEQHQGTREQAWHGYRLLRLVRQQLTQGLVLLTPDPVQPLLKLLLELGVIEVIPTRLRSIGRKRTRTLISLTRPHMKSQ